MSRTSSVAAGDPLFRRGRTSLVIGVCVLGMSVAGGNLVGSFFNNHLAELFKESLLIGGCVAIWRPMEVFLYEGARCDGRSLSVLPLDHRQRVERVLPPSINRQFHEPSMKACVRPRGGDSRDESAREAEPSQPARHIDPICTPK